MGENINRGENDESSRQRSLRTVRFPTFGVREIECPVCEGNKCIVCNGTGFFEISGEVWASIQQPHIIQYVHDNLPILSKEYNTMYGSGMNMKTLGILKKNWEVLEVSSLIGSMWICINIQTAETKHFYKEGGLKKWLVLEK